MTIVTQKQIARALAAAEKVSRQSNLAKGAARENYARWLALKACYPRIVLSPTSEIDAVWHAHILHTKKYMQDCARLFGGYLHHTPRGRVSTAAARRTREL